MDTGRSATCELLGARCVCEFPASNSAPPGGGDWERVPACVAARRGRVAAPGLRVQQGLSASTLTGGWGTCLTFGAVAAETSLPRGDMCCGPLVWQGSLKQFPGGIREFSCFI